MGAAPADMPSREVGFDAEEKYGKLRNDHQGYSSGCVSFGSTNDVEMTILKALKKAVNLSQRFIYSQIALSGGGASPRDAYKLMNKIGVCEEQYMPVSYGWTLTEAKMKDSTGLGEGTKNASAWRIGAYRAIDSLDMDVLAQAIFENGGCGGGFRPVSGQMGHFIFLKGYGMHNGCKGLKYKDSYDPFEKWIIKTDKFYLDHISSDKEVQLFSIWTAEAGNWEKVMNKLVRKKNEKEVFLQIGNKRYWVKDEKAFSELSAGGLIGSWSDIEEVENFTTSYEGDIIGSPNLADVLKNIFGIRK